MFAIIPRMCADIRAALQDEEMKMERRQISREEREAEARRRFKEK